MIAPREYSDHAPVSKRRDSILRAVAVAGGEQRRGARVAGQSGDVPQPDERLDEAVEDRQPGRRTSTARSRAPFGRLDPDAGRRRCSNSFSPAEIAGSSSSWRPSLTRRARDRLQPGALREAAHPRRRAAVEVEVVLPREPAAARDGDRHQLVEQQRGARVVALGALRVRVQLAEVRERVELEALAREVLPDELGARERDARAARRAAARPSSTPRCAASWRNSGAQPRGAQLAARGDPLGRGQDAGELVPPRAGEALDPALDVGQDRAVGVVGRLVDRARARRACAARVAIVFFLAACAVVGVLTSASAERAAEGQSRTQSFVRLRAMDAMLGSPAGSPPAATQPAAVRFAIKEPVSR